MSDRDPHIGKGWQKKRKQMAYDATAQVVQTEDYPMASNGYANLMTAPDDFHVVPGSGENAVQAVHQHIAAEIGFPLT
jgi:hypothetical protein